ncbi:MAG: hypothetical protein WCY89_04560 [Flavobacteriaceae bacterium]
MNYKIEVPQSQENCGAGLKMRKMRKTIIISSLLLLFYSFIDNKQKEITDDSQNKVGFSKEETMELNSVTINNSEQENLISIETISKLKFNDKECIEDFDSFFEVFSIDSIFQKKWILFPLKTSYYGGEYYEDLKIEYIDSTSYKFRDFSKDKYAMNQNDKYSVHIEKQGSIVNYRLLGYDNDISINYVFKQINNCWFLVFIEDSGL